MSRELNLKDAFYKHEIKNNKGIYFFWSRDWFSLRPWTYNGNKIHYIDQKVLDRDIGTMVSVFVGPLLVITYTVRKQ